MSKFKVGDKAVYKNMSPDFYDPWDGKIVQVMEFRGSGKNYPYGIIPLDEVEYYDSEYGIGEDAAESELTPLP